MTKKKKSRIKSLILFLVYTVVLSSIMDLYSEYVISRELNGYLQFVATIVMVGLVIWTLNKIVIHFANMLSIKILK